MILGDFAGGMWLGIAGFALLITGFAAIRSSASLQALEAIPGLDISFIVISFIVIPVISRLHWWTNRPMFRSPYAQFSAVMR